MRMFFYLLPLLMLESGRQVNILVSDDDDSSSPLDLLCESTPPKKGECEGRVEPERWQRSFLLSLSLILILITFSHTTLHTLHTLFWVFCSD